MAALVDSGRQPPERHRTGEVDPEGGDALRAELTRLDGSDKEPPRVRTRRGHLPGLRVSQVAHEPGALPIGHSR